MGRRVLIAAASLAATLHLPAQGLEAEPERWVAVEEDSEGTMLFFDRESVGRTGTRVRFMMRYVRAAPNWRGESSTLLDTEVNCACQTTTIHQVRSFGPEGEPLRRIDARAYARPQPMFAGTAQDPLYRIACPDGRPLPAPPTGAIAAPRN